MEKTIYFFIYSLFYTLQIGITLVQITAFFSDAVVSLTIPVKLTNNGPVITELNTSGMLQLVVLHNIFYIIFHYFFVFLDTFDLIFYGTATLSHMIVNISFMAANYSIIVTCENDPGKIIGDCEAVTFNSFFIMTVPLLLAVVVNIPFMMNICVIHMIGEFPVGLKWGEDDKQKTQ